MNEVVEAGKANTGVDKFLTQRINRLMGVRRLGAIGLKGVRDVLTGVEDLGNNRLRDARVDHYAVDKFTRRQIENLVPEHQNQRALHFRVATYDLLAQIRQQRFQIANALVFLRVGDERHK